MMLRLALLALSSCGSLWEWVSRAVDTSTRRHSLDQLGRFAAAVAARDHVRLPGTVQALLHGVDQALQQ